MARGGGNKKRFQYCTDPSGQEILYLRALHGHSGRNFIDPSLQDNVLIPNSFFEYICHIGCAINLHSITISGLIPGGQNLSKRQTVFFTSVDPMTKEHRDPDNIDLKAPRLAWYQQKKWKKQQNTVYWVDIKLAQRKGIKFYQTRSNAIILYDTLSACCIPKAIMMETGEIIHERVNASPRPPPKISFKDNLSKELGSVAGGSEDSQQTLPKTQNPIVRTRRPVKSEEIDKGVLFDCESTNVRTVRPVNSCVPMSVERVDEDKDTDENVDADQIRTGRPVESGQSIGLFTQCEEIDFDFRVSGLPHAVVKQAENFSVRELVKKIESHPHRDALQADLQQSNVYNPFTDDSKAMIREMGNVELFELCETIPKVQCSECLLYWNQGVIYCTCGHLLVESDSSQNFHRWRLDALSIPHYVIRKERPRGARHGKTEAEKEHFVAHNARKRCLKKNFDGIHDRFPRDPVYRDSQLKLAGPRRSASQWMNWHRKTTPTAHPLRSMRDVRKNWYISLNKSGRNAPMKLRSDFREAFAIMNRLHRESGEERPEPIPFHQYQRWHSSCTSWWQWNEIWWRSYIYIYYLL